MGIEDIQISEELETNAPSIKYRGDEGPRSPQQEQQMMMAQLEEAYNQYVDDMIEQGIEPMSMQQFIEQAMAEGQMSGGNPLPQDPTKPINPFGPKPTGPVLPNRQMAAYGGIMGIDGRRQYGLGSSFKKFVRKIIPNEVAEIAVKAAPFVAPFNPIAAGLMSGIGSFDQTGRIGSSLKSGLMNYGMGQVARGIGGGMDNLQSGFDPRGGMLKQGTGTFTKYFSNPIRDTGGIGKMFKENFTDKLSTSGGSLVEGVDEKALQKIADAAADKNLSPAELISKQANEAFIKNTQAKNLGMLDRFGLNNKLLMGLAAGTLGATALMGNMEPDEIQDMQRGEGLDIDGIRAEVQEAMADETGELLKALRVKYPFLGRRDTKDYAMGGRIGFNMGGGADMGAPQMYAAQAKEEAITKIMQKMQDPNLTDEERAFLQAQLQAFAMPNNQAMTSLMGNKEFMNSFVEQELNRGSSQEEIIQKITEINQDKLEPIAEPFNPNDPKWKNLKPIAEPFNPNDPKWKNLKPELMAQGGRIGFAEGGGIMDLGGMEKDYRAEGGFVPIGAKEKADDVPARLSVNEFVFTSDAVRNAGGGDIDKGAEIMENMMKNLEAGGQVSEESQGMAGAQQMFETSQRLSEVI
jgi:hypothetical protein